MAGVDDFLYQFFQTLARDAGFTPAVFTDHVIDRAHGTGGTDYVLRGQRLERRDIGFQFEVRAEDGAAHAQAVDFAIGEKFFAAADATHVQAFEKHRISHQSFLTGQSASMFSRLFVEDRIQLSGVFPPEVLDKPSRDYYLEELAKIGITIDRIMESRLF